MNEPKEMNPAELAEWLKNVEAVTGPLARLRAHLAAVEARLQRAEADNAALIGGLRAMLPEERAEWSHLYHKRKCDALSDEEAACSCGGTPEGRIVDIALAPHPGTALLKRHTREVDAAWNSAVEAVAEHARTAAESIVADLSDRRGLKQEWEQIDSDVQREIRDEWERLIADYARALKRPTT